MNAIADCTVPEKILLAAFALEENGQTPFSAEALIVSAWEKYPDTFGLKHFQERFPDSNKVLVSIMGERGLARRGWLEKLGQKMYALTREGRQAVRRLLRADEPAAPTAPSRPVTLPREQERFLHNLLTSTALGKFREGQERELTFADACRFWGITENLHGDHLDKCLNQLLATLKQLDQLIGRGSAVLPGGRSVSGEELGLLNELHAHLEQRFRRHLNLLRHRVVKG